LSNLIILFKKGDDDVALCKVNRNNTVSLLHHYNYGPYYKISSLLLSTNPRVGFTNIKTSYTNGVATCSFTRAVKMPSLAKYFDSSKSYYILAAYGPINSGLIGYHSFRQSSSSKLKL
jgi:hypothetical protein